MATSKNNTPSQDDVKLVQELAKLYEHVLEISAKDARTRAEAARQAGTLNKEIKILNNQMHEVVFQSDYLYRTFQEQTSELNKQNNLLKLGKSTFKGLTDIAQDLNHFQRGITDLTDKQLNKMESSLKIEEKELEFIIKRLANSKGEYINQSLINRLQAIGAKDMSKAQKLRLEELQKEKDLLKASQEALKSGIPILQREYELSKQIYQVNENLGGLARGAAGVVSKYGGSLAQFLNVSEASKSVDEYNRKLIDGALKDKKVRDQLLANDFKRNQAQAIFEEGLLDEVELEKKLLALDEEDNKIKKDAISSVDTMGNKVKSLGVLVKGLGEGLKKSLTDPVSILTFIVTQALKANTQAVELGKSLGYGTSRANAFRESFVDIERSSHNLNVNVANLTEAFGQLTKATGFAYQFSVDQLETQIKLTKQVGLTAEEAGNIANLGIVNGKTSEQTYSAFVRGLVATRNQLKVGIDLKATLAEAANVSGQLAANLGYNPERIAKAIVTAKAFGMTLDQVAKSADSLLNFESSIESELKAELLTGKTLNLERARAAALAGDQVTLAEELAKNVGTAADFSRMNVLQQRALAESVGMTADELANTLKKREQALASGKSLAQINEEEAKQALERQTIQDKFNAAMLKLQSLIGNILAGPLGGFIDVLSGALNIVNAIGNSLSFLATPLKVIASLMGGIWLIGKGMALTEGLTASIMGQKVGYASAELGYKVSSNVASVFGNAQAAIELATEEGIFSWKQLNLALEGDSLATKIIAYGWALKDMFVSKAKSIWEWASNTAIAGQLAKIPALLAGKGTEAALQTEIAAAATVTAEATTFGAATLWIVGGLAAVLGALAGYAMKDGVIDPNKGPVISGGFGSVQLDPNDKAMYGADGKIKVGTDLMGGGSNSTIAPTINPTPMINGGGNSTITPTIDLTPMIAAINEVKAAINTFANRPINIMMDSTKVGTGLVQSSYKTP